MSDSSGRGNDQGFCKLDLGASRVREFVAGLRPYRKGGPRLDIEALQSKVVAHNYGHGGSGITLAWGSCEEVIRRLEPALKGDTEVAVWGAGVMGLCTGYLLLKRGFSVTIYSKDFPPDTTSNVAGGLWAPTYLDCQDPHLLDRLLRESWNSFRELEQLGFGVSLVPLFETHDRAFPLDEFPEGLVGEPTQCSQSPFQGKLGLCTRTHTLLIETPKFLTRLVEEIRKGGGVMKKKQIRSLSQVGEFSEPVIVNCLGLGAREVAQDTLVRPIRGQLALLEPAAKSFVLDHAGGYIISRDDLLILGGTFEDGEENPEPDISDCEEILKSHRMLLG